MDIDILLGIGLCYVETVDWSQIAPWDPVKNLVSKNKDTVNCPGCDSSCPQGLCWSRQHCQVAIYTG